MRGSDRRGGSLFSYVDIEERIPASHPLRKVRAIVNAALTALDAEQRAHVAVEAQPRTPEQFFRHRAKRFIGHVAYTAGLLIASVADDDQLAVSMARGTDHSNRVMGPLS